MSNTETKPWEILAQKQVRDDEQRNKDEMFMNHIIKENYKKELYHQM